MKIDTNPPLHRFMLNIKTLYATLLLTTIASPLPVHSNTLESRLQQSAVAMEAQIINWRRDIHQHPELSNREERTALLVAKHLKSLGMEVKTGLAHTGVIGTLKGKLPGPVVALRADMDALPVKELTKLPFASTARGQYLGEDVPVMHACGHDNHVAILLGAATALASIQDELPGTIRFIFQPAEEGAPPGEVGGADQMILDGALENPTVDAIFGLHINQLSEAGTASYRPKGTMAGAQVFNIHIQGQQTHGARPWMGIDPIVAGAQLVNALQTIVSRSLNLNTAPAVVTVGTFKAGLRSNIIPESASLSGTIRTFEPAMLKKIQQRIQTLAQGVAQSMGATATVSFDKNVPVTFNDPSLVDAMLPTLKSVYGAENIILAERVTGAEDFSYYQEKVPGFYFFIGGRPKDIPQEKAISNHSPYFNVDEDALLPGTIAMSRLALDYLKRNTTQAN